jgi:hypothetical protein
LRKLDREKTFPVDLDGEEGRPSDSKRSNVFRIAVRFTKEVNLVLVQELLRGNQTVKIDALECLSKSWLPPAFLGLSKLTYPR